MMGFIKKNRRVILFAFVLLATGALLFSAGRLAGKLDGLQASNLALEERIGSLEKGIGEQADSADGLYHQYSDLNEALDSLNAALTGALQTLSQDNADSEMDILSLLADIDALSREVALLGGSLGDLSSRIDALKNSQKQPSVNQPSVNRPESPDDFWDEENPPIAENPGGDEEPSAKPSAEPEQIMDIRKGDKVLIHIRADAMADLYAYQFNLHYNKDELRYTGDPLSLIGEIPLIFAKDMDTHILVGATKVGAKPGYNDSDVKVCTLEFTALKDVATASFALADISIVKSDQTYIEGVTGWSIEAVD